MKIYQVHQLLKYGQEQLDNAGIEKIEARLLLEYVLKVDFTTLVFKYNETIDEVTIQTYLSYIHERIKGIPLQYITHEQHFMEHKFYVDSAVLIPRPETEMLVELCISNILHAIYQGQKKIRVLDMCTGSGCIIISIAAALHKKYPKIDFEWVGVDIQEDALKVSKRNEQSILGESMISWMQSDLYTHIDAAKSFDIIVSNPPYIPHGQLQELMTEVREYEPMVALDGGRDGLSFYRRIIEDSFGRISNGGMLLFEIGHGQMQAIKAIMEANGFQNIQEINDMAGLERIISGTKK